MRIAAAQRRLHRQPRPLRQAGARLADLHAQNPRRALRRAAAAGIGRR